MRLVMVVDVFALTRGVRGVGNREASVGIRRVDAGKLQYGVECRDAALRPLPPVCADGCRVVGISRDVGVGEPQQEGHVQLVDRGSGRGVQEEAAAVVEEVLAMSLV